MEDLLMNLNQSKAQLLQLGIREENLSEVLAALSVHQELVGSITEARKKQFKDSAYEQSIRMKAANKSGDLSQFLRNFAEHIARHTLEQVNVKPSTLVEDLVDHIPDYIEPEPEDVWASKYQDDDI